MKYLAFIGSNSIRDSRGIYSVSISADGIGTVLSAAPAYNSGALAFSADRKMLYAVSEGMSFHGRASGGVLAFDICGCELKEHNWQYSGGQRPCCIGLSENGKELYVSNFFGGSISVFPLLEDGSIGEMRAHIKEQPLPGRLDGMHCVEAISETEFGAVYLGTGSMILYDAASCTEIQRFSLAGGAFPRHFITSPDGNLLYLLLQTPAEVHVARRNSSGIFEVKQIVPATTPDLAGIAEASTLKLTPNARVLIAASRVTNTLAVYRVDESGLLTQTQLMDLPVKTPRDLCITPDGKFLLVAGQATDNICICAIDSHKAELQVTSILEGVTSPGSIVIKEDT